MVLVERCPNTVNAVYFVGINFSRLAAQKHIRRVVKFALSRCSLDIFVLHKYFTSLYKQLRSTKTKQASHILQYITHLHQHTWSIHSSCVSKMCIQNIANIFCEFLNSRLLIFCVKSVKINAPRIFPLLQYVLVGSGPRDRGPGGHFIKHFVSIFHWQICSQPIRCKDFSSL